MVMDGKQTCGSDRFVSYTDVELCCTLETYIMLYTDFTSS